MLGDTIEIYVDGGASPNPGKGAWSAYLICGDYTKLISGTADKVSNNAMELTAAIEALATLKKIMPTTIYSDSQYLVYGMTDRALNRRQQIAAGYDIPNLALWIKLDETFSEFVSCDVELKWEWVRGHNGNIGNEKAHREVERLLNGGR